MALIQSPLSILLSILCLCCVLTPMAVTAVPGSCCSTPGLSLVLDGPPISIQTTEISGGATEYDAVAPAGKKHWRICGLEPFYPCLFCLCIVLLVPLTLFDCTVERQCFAAFLQVLCKEFRCPKSFTPIFQVLIEQSQTPAR